MMGQRGYYCQEFHNEGPVVSFRFRPSLDRWLQLVTILGFSLRLVSKRVSLLTMIRDRSQNIVCRAKILISQPQDRLPLYQPFTLALKKQNTDCNFPATTTESCHV